MKNLVPGMSESANVRADNRIEPEYCAECQMVGEFSVQYTRTAPGVYDTEWTCLVCGSEFEATLAIGE